MGLNSKEHPQASEKLLAIGRDCARRLQEPYRSADHGDHLYDENGLLGEYSPY